MHSASPFQTGADTLLAEHLDWIRDRRLGIVCHAASVGAGGEHIVPRLLREADIHPARLLAPEHGFAGRAGPGDAVTRTRHPAWDIDIESLYDGESNRIDAQLEGLDVILYDLQDLAVRCFTYLSSLRYLMEACSRRGIDLVVADRPVPFADVVDGPLLRPDHESFVGAVHTPLVTGMTPGETARRLRDALSLDLNLKVSPMQHYGRTRYPLRRPPWVAPSPGIRSLECAYAYPWAVWTEALPAFSCDRTGLTPFQQIAHPALEPGALCRRLTPVLAPTARVEPCAVWADSAEAWPGLRILVDEPDRFHPVTAAIHLLAILSQHLGEEALWAHPQARPDFFDKLMGTPAVREGLQQGDSAEAIIARSATGLGGYLRDRKRVLLYGERE